MSLRLRFLAPLACCIHCPVGIVLFLSTNTTQAEVSLIRVANALPFGEMSVNG